jgi:phage terminase large subunit-like protein
VKQIEIEASPEEIQRFRELLRRNDELKTQAARDRWVPWPHQIPPDGEPGIDWFVWLLLGGRGAGKTDACAHYMDMHAKGPACIPGPVPHRMAIVAPTLGDASDACVNGPSGLRAHNGQIREVTKKGGSFALWENGSQAKLFGAYTKEEPERLRAGGNRCLVWMEEVAAWRYLAEAWKHINLGLLRLGAHPHAIASTTPRNRPTMKTIIKRARADGSLTHGTTDQNLHLAPHIREALYAEYGGTRIGEQELEGVMIEDVVGALWNDEMVEQCRIDPKDAPSDRQRLVIAVDPSWGTTNDEVGIVAGYRGPDGHAYILEDLSAILTPSAWGQVVSHAYDRLSADKVIAEGNFQGEQVRLAMKVAQTETDIRVNFDLVNASRGKALRAEPVVALYEQNRVHHIGRLAGLEYQMTHWVPPQNSDGSTGLDAGDPDVQTEPDATDVETSEEAVPSNYSPDRVDALVFLVTELLLGKGGPAQILVPKGRVTGVGRGTMRGRW